MVSRRRDCYVTNILHSIRTYITENQFSRLYYENYHEGKPLPIGTFVLKRNFTHVQFSDKLKPLRIGPYKIIDRLSDVTYELLSQDGSTIHVHRNHLIPYYPKEPLIYPHLRNFMRFSDTTQIQVPQPIKYANSDSSPFNSDESLSDDDSQTYITPSSTVTPYNTPSVPSNQNTLFEPSNHNSLTNPITNIIMSHFLKKRLSIFVHDCIECQRNKHFNQKIQTAPTQSFSEHAPSFNYRFSMDTKGPINPPSHNKSYIHVIVDAFSHFVVTVPIKSNNAKTAIKTLLHHWIIKFGPPIYLVTYRGSEYVNKEMAQLCTLMGIRHSPRTAYSPWTNGLVEVQNRNLGTHLRKFLHDTPKDWAFQVHMYAYAHNSQPLSELNVSPREIVFHTRPRVPLTFDLNLTRDTSKLVFHATQLPEHSHYDKSDLNPFFHRTLSKPIPQWFLAVETAMLQIYSTVYEHTLRKINSHAYITKTYHEGKPLPIGTFVPKRNFTHVQFSDKLKPLRIGPYKIIDRLSDVTYELLPQDGSTIHVHRNHLIPYYPKEPLIYPHLRNFMRFSDTTQIQVPQPIKYANSDSSPFNSDESLSDDDSQTYITPSSTVTPYNTPSVPSNQNTLFEPSNHNSLTNPITNDNTLYKNIINTPHTNFPH